LNKLATTRQIHDKVCLTDAVWLTYSNRRGELKSGVVTIEIEFSSSDSIINYLNIEYSDSEIMEAVESNPKILRNIDSYLRNKLLKIEYNF
jgi:hypothetical protein